MLIGHLTLTVRDPRASADFYLSVVGLDGTARDELWGCRLDLRDGFMLALIRGVKIADPDGYVVEISYDAS